MPFVMNLNKCSDSKAVKCNCSLENPSRTRSPAVVSVIIIGCPNVDSMPSQTSLKLIGRGYRGL